MPQLLVGVSDSVFPNLNPAGSPLFGRNNVILTPHTSFYSVESLVELQIKSAEEVIRVMTKQAPRNPVNPEVLQRTA